jgi:hypothetical protein
MHVRKQFSARKRISQLRRFMERIQAGYGSIFNV